MRQDKPTAPLSHKHSAHRRHTTNCHSRAHGKPFIRTRQMPRFENALTATNNKNNDNAVVIPTHNTRYTMGPRVREDDKIRDRKRLIDRSYEEEVGITKIRQDKSTTPLSRKNSAHRRRTTLPAVIPVHTGIHLSAHAGCRV